MSIKEDEKLPTLNDKIIPDGKKEGEVTEKKSDGEISIRKKLIKKKQDEKIGENISGEEEKENQNILYIPEETIKKEEKTNNLEEKISLKIKIKENDIEFGNSQKNNKNVLILFFIKNQ